MQAPPPIKRHPAFVPLSREHMSGLVQARNLIRASAGGAGDRRAAAAAFAKVWAEEIAEHFSDEEEALAGLLSRADYARLERDHGELRELARRVIEQTGEGDPAPEELNRLGMLLHEHIRWEERHAFGEAERAATPAELERLTRRAGEIEVRRPGSRARLRL